MQNLRDSRFQFASFPTTEGAGGDRAAPQSREGIEERMDLDAAGLARLSSRRVSMSAAQKRAKRFVIETDRHLSRGCDDEISTKTGAAKQREHESTESLPTRGQPFTEEASSPRLLVAANEPARAFRKR